MQHGRRYQRGTTDRESSRYALGCLHLRGGLGRIDATDGKHVLTQAGFKFPWSDDVLLPANGILDCRALSLNQPIEVGRADDWIAFRIGPWLVMLAVHKEGRYPKIDDVIPKPEAAKSRLELSADDAVFLGDVMPRLPCNDHQFEPITLDLNGRVLVRACEEGRSQPTQVELPGSRHNGEAVTLNSNRNYLALALRLGFRTLHCYGPESPVLCADDRRRFLWCLLDAKSAIPRHDDPVCVTAPAESSRPVNRIKDVLPQPNPVSQAEAPMTVTTTNQQVAASATAETPHDDRPVKRARPRPAASTIEQALALRDALRGLLSRPENSPSRSSNRSGRAGLLPRRWRRLRSCRSPTIDADADSPEDMLREGKLVSDALAKAGITHRFEIYSQGDEMVPYLHCNWPLHEGV